MRYRHLGKAGIRVSELGFGSWITFGESLDLYGVRECIHAAFDSGVNFFDNAEAYAGGASELLMGEVMRQYRREDLVLSTKIFWGGQGPNEKGLSWKHLVEGTKNSLRRLQLEYVDLLFCHRPDPETPIEETVRAMEHLVRSGLVFYWGTSEWSAGQIRQAHEVARQLNAYPPQMEQPEYNLFRRERVEHEYDALCESGMGLTTWSPLESGILTGKYNDGIPEGTRLSRHEELQGRLSNDKVGKLQQLGNLAQELGCTQAQLSIAWCLLNPHVSSVITGATSVDQVYENMGSIRILDKFKPDVIQRIEQILRT